MIGVNFKIKVDVQNVRVHVLSYLLKAFVPGHLLYVLFLIRISNVMLILCLK